MQRTKLFSMCRRTVNTIHTAPWTHCPNRNVFSDRRNSLYNKSASFRCDGRLFHSPGPAAPNAVSPKQRVVRDALREYSKHNFSLIGNSLINNYYCFVCAAMKMMAVIFLVMLMMTATFVEEASARRWWKPPIRKQSHIGRLWGPNGLVCGTHM